MEAVFKLGPFWSYLIFVMASHILPLLPMNLMEIIYVNIGSDALLCLPRNTTLDKMDIKLNRT